MVNHSMIRMMCGVILIHRVWKYVLHDKVGIVVKIGI